MTGTEYTVKNLVNQFNIALNLDFKQILKRIEDPLKQAVVKKYNSGLVKTTHYPFGEFVEGLEQLTGDMKYQDAAKAYDFTITNVKWGKGYKVDRGEFERAQNIQGLNFYQQQINELQIRAVDHPYERAMTLLINGAASTYGTCFDGQNLFDTTHSFSNTSGAQSNIVSGTGSTTLAALHTDILSAIGALAGFSRTNAASETRLLNKVTGIHIVCDPSKYHLFLDLMSQTDISSTVKNSAKSFIKGLSVYPQLDAKDYQVIDVSESGTYAPIIYQEEVAPEFRTPNTNSDSFRKADELEWDAYYRGQQAYGAWWKAVVVNNS